MLNFISRREFVKLLAGTALGMWFMGKFAKSAMAASSEIKYLRQMITEDSSNSRVIMWQSLHRHDEAVLHCLGADGMDKAFLPQIREFCDNSELIYMYTVKLQGLISGQGYRYRVQINEESSSWHDLLVPRAGAPFKVLIFPDSQCSDGYMTWRKVAHAAYDQHPDAEFFISMGDLVDNGEAAWQWRQWMDGTDRLWKRLPFAPVMGNHECYNLQWLCRLPHAYLNYFVVPYNGSRIFSKYYYSYDYGPVHFIVLNTMWDEIDDLQAGLVEEELSWLEQDVAMTERKWKVVLMHKDVIFYDDPRYLRSKAYPNNVANMGNSDMDWQNLPEASTHDDIDYVGKVFMPYFDKLGIDLVLTAHQHTYRRHDCISDFSPSDGGPVYICTGVAGNVRYNVGATRRFDKVVLPQPEINNYMTLTASDDELTINCYDIYGNRLDEFTITYSNDKSLDS